MTTQKAKGVVAAGDRLTAAAGAEVLAHGGNAVDAGDRVYDHCVRIRALHSPGHSVAALLLLPGLKVHQRPTIFLQMRRDKRPQPQQGLGLSWAGS